MKDALFKIAVDAELGVLVTDERRSPAGVAVLHVQVIDRLRSAIAIEKQIRRAAGAVKVAKSSHSEDEEDIFRLLGGE